MSGSPAAATSGNGEDAWHSVMINHVAAIQLCLANQLRMPALMLIYCGIDFMGFLARPSTSGGEVQKDFIKWAESKMDCRQRLGVSGLDLYAARCSIVHTYTMESSLSKKGKAHRIIYAWGNADIKEPSQVLQSLGRTEKLIKIEALSDAFAQAITVFEAELKGNENFASIVLKRSRQLFQDQQFFPTNKNRHLWE